jgi:isopropylmalate/homocitrate/citramalate synthase
MLSEGEHVILDLDHLVILLEIVEECNDERFWNVHKEIAKNHAEQFSGMEIEKILRRLEICNFFRLGKTGNEYILVFGSNYIKKFVREFLEEIMKELNKKVEIKENLTKIRIKVLE